MKTMAIRNIIKKGDELLLKRSREVTKFDRRLHTLIDDMKDTLLSVNGVGIAAPQVGVLRRVFLVDDGEKVTEYINPEILEMSGECEDTEGCLSVPGRWGIVLRPEKVVIRAFDRDGNEFTVTGEGTVARAFCHETEHLDGLLFDRLIIREVEPEKYEIEEDGEKDKA